MSNISEPRTSLRRLARGAGLAALGLVAVAALAPLAQAQARQPEPVIPKEISVPEGNKLFLEGHAFGVQIYECVSDSTGFNWRFVAPRASLFDDEGKLIITHFGGPTWQALDSSRFVGKLDAGVTVKRSAIPWLLLSRASTSPGPDGGDQLADTTFIQRISTKRGLAPALALCNKRTLGIKVESRYTADYLFYKAG